MRINRLDLDNFATIRDEWNQLLQNSGSQSIFLTWEWVFTWWTVFGNDSDRLYVLTAHDTQGQLIGIAPCYIRRGKKYKLLSIKEVRFLGHGGDICPEYLDFVTEPQRRGEIVGAFFRYFLSNQVDWDVLNLTDLLEHSAVIDYVKELERNNGVHLIRRKHSCCPYAPLPDSWERYINSLGKSTRYDIRRKARKLEQNFNVNFHRWSDIDSLEFAMQKLAELHTERWEQQDISYTFSEDKFNEFHKQIARKLFKLGLLRLYVLELDGLIAAMLYCFKYNDTLFYYQSGFDPQYSKYSVGTVLFANAIQDAIAERIKEFDFLRGHHTYKYHWANSERETIRLAIGRDNLACKIYFFDNFGRHRIKDYLREHLPSGMYQSLRRIKQGFPTQRRRRGGKPFSAS